MRNGYHKLLGIRGLAGQAAQGLDHDTVGFFDELAAANLPTQNTMPNLNVEPNPQAFDTMPTGPNTPASVLPIHQPVKLVWGGGDRGGRS